MDLIPHQLSIAAEVTGRERPRVLLADEVGLGKTIEACLILHRMLATGRAARVLVVVPEPLVHQWFVELLRRFNLRFHIFDEERCRAIAAGDPEANPFLDDQWVLCGLPLLLNPGRAAQAGGAGWDLLVVDEAHHLRWGVEGAGPEYLAVERVSRSSECLLLLTATPEQLGLAGHFARLRLLDPDRYPDLKRFEEETRHYGEVASVANRLAGGAKLSPADRRRLHGILGSEPGEIQGRLEALARGDAAAREALVSDLLDRHGTGRVMFRNTRAAMKGFPRRVPCPEPLTVEGETERELERLAWEFEADRVVGERSGAQGKGTGLDLGRDPRIVWLAGFLRNHPEAKVLTLTRTREKVVAIDEALRREVSVPTALFHEDLELVQRDRNAAWFAEPDGARMLVASEIGSEGRNFQFAHHLVLFDLPLDPELVEQRIGRLDRIGQSEDIRIHVPYVRGSAQEVLFRWFHEGLDAFGHNLVAGRELLERFGEEVRDLAQDYHETQSVREGELDDLVERTRKVRKEIEQRLEAGRDRLLELNSFRPAVAERIVEGVRAMDREPTLEAFMLEAWDHYGVPVEDLGPRRYRLGGDGVYSESFPGLPSGGCLVTFDRALALVREDLVFLTWDHPMVTGALDLLLGSPDGNSAWAVWPEAPRRGLWLETVHLVECVAPARWMVDRFLPATPIRLWVDARGGDVTAEAERGLGGARLVDGDGHEDLDSDAVRSVLPSMLAASRALAEGRAGPVREEAVTRMEAELGHEAERLRALAAVNPAVRPEEVEGIEARRAALRGHLLGARLRLDAVRWIWLGAGRGRG